MKLVDALPEFDVRLLNTSEGRIALTEMNPLLFAAVYLPNLLKSASGEITLNQFHLDICNYALAWSRPLGKMAEHRDCFIAPRGCGKSTWIFHILPLWAAAHGHKKYIVAFSDTEDQARGWLMNFKNVLASNELIQEDYPDLCEPFKRHGIGKALMDNRNATKQANGFIFQAKGADSSVLGANIDGMRPEVLLFDDIEPPEANYGETELKKRKDQILSTHFYLNTFAIVAFVGTTTMPNSLIDQMRKVGEAREFYDGDPALFSSSLDSELRWVAENNIKTHYYPVIFTDENGEEHSLWPEKWSLDALESQRTSRDFAKNMMNKPVSLDEGYWGDGDIDVDQLEDYGNTILSVDPAVTTARRSDYTGLSVISKGKDGKIYVRYSNQVKMDSDGLRELVSELVDKFGVGLMLVEVNQGGNLWKQVFKDVPVRKKFLNQKIKKEVRIAQAADFYKKKRVIHTAHFSALEEQMLAFPKVAHDDLVDSVATGVLYFARPSGKVTATQFNYMEV